MGQIHLHNAAASGNFRGGPYNARNETAPLHVVSFNEELEVVRPLLEHSADIKTKTSTATPHCRMRLTEDMEKL